MYSEIVDVLADDFEEKKRRFEFVVSIGKRKISMRKREISWLLT